MTTNSGTDLVLTVAAIASWAAVVAGARDHAKLTKIAALLKNDASRMTPHPPPRVVVKETPAPAVAAGRHA